MEMTLKLHEETGTVTWDDDNDESNIHVLRKT